MTDHTWPGLTATLMAGRDLDVQDTSWAMSQVMQGQASAVQLAGFLVALRAKGESVAEMAGLVESMLSHAVRISVPGDTVDVVGTGGDRQNTVNVSTMAGLVAAGAGARVVKHGNRAASSMCGAADVLEALGVNLALEPQRVAQVAVDAGMTFCFAAAFHPAMRHAGVARKELGLPTAFNFLGPLTNPAQPVASAIGVADARMAPIMAGVLAGRGRRGLVFRGEDGLDELTTTGPSTMWRVQDGEVQQFVFDPADVGIPRASLSDLRGGDVQTNAQVVRDTLAGRLGPVRDIVVLNAAAALVALSASRDIPAAMAAAVRQAADAIDSGAAAEVLTRWVTASAA